jgi:hypothetical protein
MTSINCNKKKEHIKIEADLVDLPSNLSIKYGKDIQLNIAINNINIHKA